MDTETLVVPHLDPDVELGERVLEGLRDVTALNVRAVIWWFDSEAAKWKLLVATPVYDTKGPREAYGIIRKSLETNNLLEKLPLDRVWAVEENHPVVEALRRTSGHDIGHVRFVNCILFGMLIPDAYILWVGKKRAGARKKKRS